LATGNPMSNRISRDNMLTAIAVIVSRRSTCDRLQVGAVIATDGRILSTGYAGAPSGFEHCNTRDCDLEKPCTRTVHAESNSIAFAARHGIKVDGSTLYVTHSPCLDCAKLIINSGIKRVVYLERYRLAAPIDLLKDAGLEVEQSHLLDWIPE
jgi:dCMP deaminase